jgi:hypothetical protein
MQEKFYQFFQHGFNQIYQVNRRLLIQHLLEVVMLQELKSFLKKNKCILFKLV